MSLASGFKRLTSLDLATLYRMTADWPVPCKALLGVGVFCLLVGLGDVLYLSTARDVLNRHQAQEVVLSEQLSLKTVQAARLVAVTGELEASRAAFARQLRQLPIDTEVPGLLEDITRLGSTNGLVLSAITLLDEQPQPLYVELPLQMSVAGQYHDLAGFISGLGGLSRIVTVHDMKISANEAVLRLDVLAKTYRYNPQGDADLRSLASGETPPAPRFTYDPASLRDPFQPAAVQLARPSGRPAAAPDVRRPRGFLEGFAVEQFDMVGTVSRGGHTFALLRGASAVHRLGVGDYLGPDYGRVTAIDDDHVELAELFPDGEGAWLERSRTLFLTVNS
ncbi:pilus assembly protein PilP [Pseudomonas sp. SDO528_S397]